MNNDVLDGFGQAARVFSGFFIVLQVGAHGCAQGLQALASGVPGCTREGAGCPAACCIHLCRPAPAPLCPVGAFP